MTGCSFIPTDFALCVFLVVFSGDRIMNKKTTKYKEIVSTYTRKQTHLTFGRFRISVFLWWGKFEWIDLILFLTKLFVVVYFSLLWLLFYYTYCSV